MPSSKSDEAINAFIKSEVDAQREQLAFDIESKMRLEFDNRVAEQVRVAIQTLTNRAAGDMRQPVVVARSSGCKEPPRYGGSEIGTAGTSWISLMDEHLRQMKIDEPLLSEEKLVAIAISFTFDSARDFSIVIRDELGASVTWKALKAELLSRFGVKKSTWHLLQELREIKQGRSSISEYVNGFEGCLGHLVSAGFTDSLTSVTYFIEGLNREMRQAVCRSFLSLSEDPMESYKSMKPRQAVRAIAKLASRCEEIELLLSSKIVSSEARAAVAVVAQGQDAGESRVAVAQVKNAGRPAGSWRREKKEQPFTRDDLISHLARKHEVPRDLVDQRLKANLCAACAGCDHTARTCTNPPVKGAPSGAGAPSSGGAQQTTNAKAH